MQFVSDHVCSEIAVIPKFFSRLVTVQSPPLAVERRPLLSVKAPVSALPAARLLPLVVTTPEMVPVVVWPLVPVNLRFSFAVVLPMFAGEVHVIVAVPLPLWPIMPLQRTSAVCIEPTRLPPVTKPPVHVRPFDATLSVCGPLFDKRNPGLAVSEPVVPEQLKPPPEAPAWLARAMLPGTNNAAAIASRPRMRIPNPL